MLGVLSCHFTTASNFTNAALTHRSLVSVSLERCSFTWSARFPGCLPTGSFSLIGVPFMIFQQPPVRIHVYEWQSLR
jgi:hypothetical protein